MGLHNECWYFSTLSLITSLTELYATLFKYIFDDAVFNLFEFLLNFIHNTFSSFSTSTSYAKDVTTIFGNGIYQPGKIEGLSWCLQIN